MGEFIAGRLLVATPSLVDPNFARTVVLILAHSDEGAFGIVINRPRIDFLVADHLAQWSEHVAGPAVFFSGGPVEPAAAIGLARGAVTAGPQDGWNEVCDGLGVINLESPPAVLLDRIERVRIFTGYAGWSPGQLEQEIEGEAWFNVAAEPGDPFCPTPERLWHDVLRRQAGRLAMFAYFPESPRNN